MGTSEIKIFTTCLLALQSAAVTHVQSIFSILWPAEWIPINERRGRPSGRGVSRATIVDRGAGSGIILAAGRCGFPAILLIVMRWHVGERMARDT